MKHFDEKPLLRFKAEDVSGYQKARLDVGVSGRTVNMETGVLRRMLKRAKVWNAISEDVKALPEQHGAVGKVLPPDLKRKLFETAASRPEWLVAHCAAVLAVSTTCRGVEIKNLRWQDVDLFGRVATIRRSKTAAGHRNIPLNGDAMAALARLLERAQALGSNEPEHYVFPAARCGLLIPRVHRRVGARHGESLCEKQPGASAERPRKRCSSISKASEPPSQPGNEPPHRSAAYASTIFVIRPSRKWRRRAHPMPRSWPSPATCRVGCWNITATCVWPPSARSWKNWKAV
jgi:hypothetical protein